MFDQQQLNRLYSYAMNLCNHPQDAYDLLQQGLEIYLRKKIEAKNPEAYLRRTIRNNFIDQCRQQRRLLSEQDYPLDSGSSPLAIGTRCLEEIVISQNQLDAILQLLTSQERELLYLWGLLEMNARENAEELQLPRGTVLSRIHRLRKKLRQADKNSTDVVQQGGIS